MRCPTFRQWLRQFARDESPLGDLARDVRADRSWPTGRRPLARYEAYMESVAASPLAVAALHDAWELYQEHTSAEPNGD